MGLSDFRIQIAGAGFAAQGRSEPRGAGRRERAGFSRLVQIFALVASLAVPAAFAASTTISALLDTDNNAATGCTISTVNGAFAGVERVLATKVVTNTAGYRTDSITVQMCLGGTLGAPIVVDSQSLPIAPGNGINGSSAVETYIPAQFLPNDGKKIRIGVTTLGADGLTGGDALTLTSAGDAILVDGPILMVVPTLAAASLLLTALLLVGSLWLARRRGWHGMQLVLVAVFALSLSGQLIAAVITRDGLINDWSGIAPEATDPVGDGQAGSDIVGFFSTPSNGFLNLRVDVVLNSPPEATAQSVTAIVGQGLPITLTGTDFEPLLAPLTFSIVTPPTQGVLTGVAPNLVYTPNPTAINTDSFTFKANDGALDSAPATVAITVTRAPAIVSVDNTVFIPTQANSFAAFASNGMPTPTLSFGACSPALPSVTFVANGSGGGTLSGNPSIAEAGVHTCTLTATNGVLPNATQTFTVTVGGLPTITSVDSLSVPELAAFSHTVTAASVLAITGITSSGTLPVVTAFTYAGAAATSATLGGTPAVCSRGSFPITFAATNSVGSGSQSFTLTVRPVNQVPSFSKGADVTVLEDAAAQTISGWATALNKGAACENSQALSFEITGNSNPTLFSVAPAVNGSNGNLSFTPAVNANGIATITLRIKDDGGITDGGVDTSAAQSFNISVTPVNDTPSFTSGGDITVLEDAGPQSVTGWATALSKGPADEAAQTLNFIVTNNNNALFATQPTVSPTGDLTYLTGPNANGVAIVTVQLRDNGAGSDTSATQTFTITVTPVNDAPSFAAGASVTVLEDAGFQTLANWATAISKGPPDEATQSVTFSIASNTNPALFLVAPAVSATGTLTYITAANGNGSAIIGIRLQDDGGTANSGIDTSATQSFTITVTPVNDAPSFTIGADQTVLEDAGAQTIPGWASAFVMGPADESGQAVQAFIVSNNNNALFAVQPAIAINGSLSFTPAANQNGIATVTVQLQDNGGTANGGVDTSLAQTFTIAVTAVNDVPSFTRGADQTVLEDSGPQTLANWAFAISAGPANEAAQTLTFNVTANTVPTLFSAGPAVSANGTLTFTPAPDANGSATITINLQDNGGTANLGVDTSASQTFVINVTPVNDAPSFTSGGDITVLEDAGPQSVTGWATALSKGPADESAQMLNFIVSNSNNALFATQPSISPTGDLTYLTAPHGNGMATVSVQLQDNGGTANFGVDTSAAQTFTITVTPVNDAPSFVAGSNVTVLEDSGVYGPSNWATAMSAGPNETGQALSFVVSNDNISLFSAQPAVNATGQLSFTPAADRNGVATVTVQIKDNGGTASLGVDTSAAQTFVINVTAVNDVPSFIAGGNQTVLNTAGAQSVPGWASAISRGPVDEAGQSVSFNITNNTRPALFAVLPAVDSSGTLTYTPVVGQSGVATITLNIQDNGGTANSGIDTSATQSFTITVQKAPTIGSPASKVFPITTPVATSTVFTITTTGVPDVSSITLTACAPALPPEFVFNYLGGTTATITGAPTGPGNIVCTVTASNTINPDATQTLTLIPGTPPDAIDDALQVLNGGTLSTNLITGNGVDIPGIPNGTVATFGGGSLGGTVASNPAGPLAVTLAGGSLTLATNGDLVLTNPNINGTYTFNYSLGNVVGADPALVTIIVGTLPTVTGAPAATATIGAAYSAVFTVAGSPTPTVSNTGSLPPGITRTGSTLSGTPTTIVGSPFSGTVVGTNIFGSGSAPSGAFGITVSCDVITVNPTTDAALGSPFVLNAAITPVNLSATSSTSNPGGYTFAVTSGALPTGLSLSAAGQLTGTPTAGGASTFTITATHASTCTGARNYAVGVQRAVTAVNDSASAILPTPIAAVTISSGSTGLNPLANDVPSGFPIGTIVSFGGGSLGGTVTSNAPASPAALAGGTLTVNSDGSWSLVNPTTAGVYTFLYRLGNSIPSTSDATVTLTLNKAPTINSASSASFTIGQSGSFTVTTTNTHPVAAITRTGTLVSGLNFIDNNNGTATISGTAAAGTTSANVQAITANNTFAPNATQNLTLNVACPAITVSPAAGALPQVTLGAGLNNTFTNTGGNGSVNFSSTGTLPTGGALSSGGVLTGTTTAAGNFGFSVVATDGFACSGTTAYTLRVCPAISTAAITVPTHLRDYSHLLAASGGSGPYTYATGGTLPTGITLSVATLSGTNIAATGAYSFTVTATDSNGCAGTTTMSGTVNEPPVGVADSYEYVGNTQLEVNASAVITTPKIAVTSAAGVLSNDTDAGGGTIAVSGMIGCGVPFAPFNGCPTTNGGSVNMNGNGTFTFTPKAGDTAASDSFTYVVSDGLAASSAIVTLNRVGRVVYVQNNFATAGSGRSHDPHKTLAAASAASVDGDTIYVYNGDGTTTGQDAGIVLKNNQKLLGQGVALNAPGTVNGVVNPQLIAAGAKAWITHPNPLGVSVAIDNTAGARVGMEVRGLKIGGHTAGVFIVAANAGTNTGQFTISDCDFEVASTANGITANNGGGSNNTSLAMRNLNFLTGQRGVVAGNTAGKFFITDFSNITGSGALTLETANFNNTTFDASPSTVPFTTVNGGVFTSGSVGNPSGGGLTLTSVTGDLLFTDFQSYSDSTGTGLRVSSTGAVNVGAGTGFRVATPTGRIDADRGQAINVNNASINLTLTQLNATESAGGGNDTGVSLVNAFGGVGGTALSAPVGSIVHNVTGSADTFLVNGGNGNVSYGGTITAARPSKIVNVTNRTSDTVTFSGAITDTGTGISLTNNTGATINFTGGINLSTGANTAFTATGGGTVSATQNNTSIVNTLTTTTGTALNVANTGFGASGFTVRSINTSGASTGILLTSTSGNLTVTGTCSGCANGSGGSLSNSTSAAMTALTSSGTVSLSSMNFTITILANHGILFDNNAGGTLVGNITGCTFTGAGPINGVGTPNISQNKSMLQFEGGGAANVTPNVQNSFFFNNRTYGFAAIAVGTSIMNVTLNQSGFGTEVNTGAPINTPGATITNPPPFSMLISNSSAAQVDYNVTNNTFWGARGLEGAIFALSISGASTVAGSRLNGTISGNKIGKAGAVGSGCAGNCGGLNLYPGVGGAFKATVTGNDIRQTNSVGMSFANTIGATSTYSAFAKIKGNTFAEPDTTGAPLFQRAIQVLANSGGGNATVCVELGDNTGLVAGDKNNISGAWAASNFIRVSNLNNATVLTLPGLSPTSGATAAQVNAFIQTHNTFGAPATGSDVNATLGVGINGGSPCL